MQIINFDKLTGTIIPIYDIFPIGYNKTIEADYQIIFQDITVHEQSLDSYIHKADILIDMGKSVYFKSQLVVSTGEKLYKSVGLGSGVYGIAMRDGNNAKSQVGFLTIHTNFKNGAADEIHMPLLLTDIKRKDIFLDVITRIYADHMRSMIKDVNNSCKDITLYRITNTQNMT